MIKTIKILIMFSIVGAVVLLPKASFAWDGQGNHNGRDDGRSHHDGHYYTHRNPDLTLISGMDTIDSRVLIAADPDQSSQVIEQPVEEMVITTPSQIPVVQTDTFTVNIPNDAGGFTPLIIRRWGNGYLGPQGEFYYPFPEISQLKAMYRI